MKEIPSLSYKSDEMNLDLVEQAIKNIIHRGFAPTVLAVTLYDFKWYLGREYARLEGKSDDLMNVANVEIYEYDKNNNPVFCPAVMKLINTYFSKYRIKIHRTREYLYYAPKNTPIERIKDWLRGIGLGTIVNPGY